MILITKTSNQTRQKGQTFCVVMIVSHQRLALPSLPVCVSPHALRAGLCSSRELMRLSGGLC